MDFVESKKKEAFWLSVSAVMAFMFLLVASKSSPLYPMNDWVDMHCFLTVGRGWRDGLLPYRDLIDHKGPLIYFLFGLGTVITPGSYHGLFVLETLAVAAAMFFGWPSSS